MLPPTLKPCSGIDYNAVNVINKLASLEATLVRNSAHSLTHLLPDRGKV